MKKKRLIIIISVLCAVLIIAAAGTAVYFIINKEDVPGAPEVSMYPPVKISEENEDVFTVDMHLSDLGGSLYPAVSFSISFDNEKLEFTGIKEGDIYVHGDDGERTLPSWKCGTAKANEDGLINIMYLDISGGKYAFDRNLIEKDEDILLSLEFRLKNTAKKGDIYELAFEDACFAAADKEDSLSVSAGNLDTENGRIVIGG